MNNLLKELAEDPSCILALFPDNGGEWCSPIHTPQPRDFTKEYHWDKLHTALQSLPWENDYHFEFKFTVHDFDTGSRWIMYQSAGRIVFSIEKDGRGCRFVFGSYSFTDSAPIYTSFVPSLTGEHVVTVAVVGSTFKVTVDGTTYEKSGERVASSEYDRAIMTVAPVSIHSVALTDDTVSNVLWTAGYDELYDTNIPIPSSVPRNFAEEPEAWRDEKTTAPAIEEDDCEFFIRYRLDGYLEGSVISEIFYHNSQNGSINIAFAGNGTGGNYSVIRLTGAGAFVIPLDRVRQLGEHTIRIQRIGQTVTVEFDGEIVATSTGAEKVAVYSTTAPVSDFDGVIFETYWKSLTTGRTVWRYPSEAERVRLITKTNVRTDNGVFESANNTSLRRIKTLLDLRGNDKSLTLIARTYIPSHADDGKLHYNGLISQGLATGSSTQYVFGMSIWEDFRAASAGIRIHLPAVNKSNVFQGAQFQVDETILDRPVTITGVFDFEIGEIRCYVDDIEIGSRRSVLTAFGTGASGGDTSNSVSIMYDTSTSCLSNHSMDWALIFEDAFSIDKVKLLATTPPPDDRAVRIVSLHNDWQYAKPNSESAACSLPHSVNADDSATRNYYRGTVTYKRALSMDISKRYYLILDGANQRGTVSLNGTQVGTVTNAYQPSVIALPINAQNNGSNEIQIALTNASDSSTIPYAADYNFYNGLDRGVRLMEVGSLCFDPVLYGTRRCRVSAEVSSKLITVNVNLLNRGPIPETCNIEAKLYLNDATVSIASIIVSQTVSANGNAEIVVTFDASSNFCLWNGRNGNSAWYRVELQLKRNDKVLDTVVETTGFRTFSVEKHTTANDGPGFLLNGSAYALYGTNYHTDKTGRASALTASDYAADLLLMDGLRPTMIKFAHYTCDHSLLDYCDKHGIVVMLEIPWSRDFPPATSSIAAEYRSNITSAMLNMVKEYGNHPSVVFWCFDNELGMDVTLGYNTDELHTFLADLYTQVKTIDPQRLVGAGFYVNTSGERGWTDVCDLMLSTHYRGWYGGSVSNSLAEANGDNASMAMPKAINEYGYGANPAQHVAWSNAANSKPASPNSYDSPQYEEYQAYALEQYLKQFEGVRWPVFNLQWAMFDFAVASRAEGGTTAINTKGLVSRDRTILKDSYYLYKAYWNRHKDVVHICQKRWIDRDNAENIALHVYANGEKLELYHNETLVQTLSAPNGTLDVCWDFNAVTVVDGENNFEVRSYASASDSTSFVSDSWTYVKEVVVDTPVVVLSGDDVVVNSGKLYADVSPVGISQAVTWSSSDDAIATVDTAGNIEVLLDGEVTFTATSSVDTSVSDTKVVKCRKPNNSLDVFHAVLEAKAGTTDLGDGDIITVQGVTFTFNGDGTVTLNGTASAPTSEQPVLFDFWRPAYPENRGCFPYTGIEGELLVYCEYVSGSVSNWNPSANAYWRVGFTNDTGVSLTESYLAPLGSPLDWNINGRTLLARCLIDNGGIGQIVCAARFNTSVVFNQLTYRIRVVKVPTSFYDTGLLTNVPVENSYFTSRNGTNITGMIGRNVDGTFVVHPFNPGSMYMFMGGVNTYIRLWDSFDVAGSKHTSGSTVIGKAGTALKLSVDLMKIPEIKTINTNSQFRWVLRGADGSVVTALDHVQNGTGVVSSTFESGHAEVVVTPTVNVLGVELFISNIAFSAPAHHNDNSLYIRFAMKVEEV